MTGEPPRILIIEDDTDTRDLLCFMLTLEKFEAVPAKGVGDGLTIALQRGLDLIIIDNWLAEGSGVMLCQYLRAFDQETPILFHSAAAYEADKQAAFKAGAQEYITKPADPDHLLQTVKRLIAQSNARKLKEKSANKIPPKS